MMHPTPGKRLAAALGGLIVLSVFVWAWLQHPDREMAGFASAPGTTIAVGPGNPRYESRFASSDLDEFVHAPAITALPDGGLFAVWFAGSREGAADVEIRGARLAAGAEEWGDELVLVTRESTQSSIRKHIRKLGNPVVALAPDNRLWLFYVSVSVGGWAGSAINAMVSDDLGATWSAPRQLVTTPFMNISTLVRSAPVFHQDGSIGLPVYHEFLGKFAEYLYLGPDGRVVDKFRISYGKHSLQPTVVTLDEHRAVALLRYAGTKFHRVLASSTDDGGRTWSEPRPVAPANPNSSLSAVGAADQRVLVSLNDLEDGRFRLSLYGTDARMEHWRPVTVLDQSPDPAGAPFPPAAYRQIIAEKFLASSGEYRRRLLDAFLTHLDERVCRSRGCEFHYEYPYMIRSGDGTYHLVYAWNNSFIKHISFNAAWLEEHL